MPWKQKKKVKATDEELEIEMITRVKVIYEDTKAVKGIAPEYKGGNIPNDHQSKCPRCMLGRFSHICKYREINNH